MHWMENISKFSKGFVFYSQFLLEIISIVESTNWKVGLSIMFY
jgi:hypothetical protein